MKKLILSLLLISTIFSQHIVKLKKVDLNQYLKGKAEIVEADKTIRLKTYSGMKFLNINNVEEVSEKNGTIIWTFEEYNNRIIKEAQEVEKSITLKKGENIIEIKPGDRVYVRYYKNLPNRDRSLNILPGSISQSHSIAKATSYLGIDRTLKVLKTDEERISLSDLYSISPVSNGTMATKYASNCFMVGCSAVTIFFAIASGGNIEFTLVFSAVYGGIVGGVAGLLGLYYGSSYPNIDNEYVIDSNEWVIVENE